MGGFLTRALPGALAAAAAALSVLGFDSVLKERPVTSAAPQDTPATRQPGSAASQQPDAATAGCAVVDDIRGSSELTPWGPVQVVAEVDSAGTLCSVSAIAYPDSDGRSQMINSRAIPQLDSRALADGAAFDAVSGATFTSEAYRGSLQSILDSL